MMLFFHCSLPEHNSYRFALCAGNISIHGRAISASLLHFRLILSMIVVTHTAVVQVLIHMEWIADPSIWAGLVTLVVIELVLGIDNLVFIAILAEGDATNLLI